MAPPESSQVVLPASPTSPPSRPASPSEPVVEAPLAIIDQQLSELSGKIEAVRGAQEEDGTRILELEKYRSFIEGLVIGLGIVSSVVVGLIFFLFWRLKKQVDEKGVDGLVDGVAELLVTSKRDRLTSLWDAQLEETRHRILSRDRKVLLLGPPGQPDQNQVREAGVLKRSLEAIGFKSFTQDLREAELVLVVGKEACTQHAANLAEKLRTRFVPVVFYFGVGRLDPDPTPEFECAVIANSRATALVHVSNLALLLRQAPELHLEPQSPR